MPNIVCILYIWINYSKSNIVKHMNSFWYRKLKPLPVPWDHLGFYGFQGFVIHQL